MKKWIFKCGGMLFCSMLIIMLSIAGTKDFGKFSHDELSPYIISYLEEMGIKSFHIKSISTPKKMNKSVKVRCTKEEIEEYIKTELENYDSLEEMEQKTVRKGDFIKLEYDFEESFRNAQETVLQVGNNLFDAEIEKMLIGKEKQKKYYLKGSTGEPVYVRVKAIVKYVQQTLTEEFIKETLGFASKEEYEAHVKSEVLAEKKQSEETEIVSSFYNRLISESNIILNEKEVSEFCIKNYVQNEQQMAIANNMSFEEYIQDVYQIDKEEYYKRIYEQGEREIKQVIAIGVLASRINNNKTEDFNVIEEDVLQHFIFINYI